MNPRLTNIGSKLIAFVTILMTLLGALTLLPTSLGGGASFLITSGNSMEPGIHDGDLAILRRQSVYGIDDIVAYEDPSLGSVLHRIVAAKGRRFMLQGDNNDFVDNYHPSEEEIVGELWIHLPGMGKWLDRMRQPVPMMLLAAFAGFVMVAPRKAIRRLRRRTYRPPAQRRPEHPQRNRGGNSGPAGILGPDGHTAMMVAGIVAVASLLLALLAFSRSTEQQTTDFVNFQHSGEFSYAADARGEVYENGTVETGQPVYLELVDSLDVGFSYQLDSDLEANASGTYRVDAVVAYDEGLSRTIPLVPETAFEGTEFTTSATLDIDDAQQYIEQVAGQIGADNGASRNRRVTIVPTVNLTGAIGNQSIDETFTPSLDFELDAVALRMAETTAAIPNTGTGDASQASSPLQPVKTGLIERPSIEPSTLSFLMLDVTVSTARQITIAGLLLSAIAGAVLAWLYAGARRAPEPSQIRARYSPLLVKVNGSDLGINGHDGHIIEVASIEDLARVAEREGRMILHQQHGSRHEYFVQDVDVTYSYTSVEGSRTQPRGIPEAEPSA